MHFKVIFGKGLVYSIRCTFLHIKHRNLVFTFLESEENLAFITLLHQLTK